MTPRLALSIQRGAQERHGRNAGNFHRILEREEHALRGALIWRHLQQVFTLKQHFAAGDFIAGLAGNDVAQRRFAGAVRPHNGVDFALVHFERKPVKDLTIVNADLQIPDFEQLHLTLPVPRSSSGGALKARLEGRGRQFCPSSFEMALSGPPQDEGRELTDRAFERDRDQLLRFDREFHRQLLQHVFHKTVDHETDGFLLRQPALHAIEQHVLGNL